MSAGQPTVTRWHESLTSTWKLSIILFEFMRFTLMLCLFLSHFSTFIHFVLSFLPSCKIKKKLNFPCTHFNIKPWKKAELHLFSTSHCMDASGRPQTSSRFTPGERRTGTCWTGTWVVSRARLEVSAKKENSYRSGNHFPPFHLLQSHNIDSSSFKVTDKGHKIQRNCQFYRSRYEKVRRRIIQLTFRAHPASYPMSRGRYYLGYKKTSRKTAGAINMQTCGPTFSPPQVLALRTVTKYRY